MTVRFLLGVFEASLLPSFIIVSSLWFKKKELLHIRWHFRRSLNYGIGHIGVLWKHGDSFFFYLWSLSLTAFLLCFFYLPDSIGDAWFLDEREKEIAKARVANNQTGTSMKSNGKIFSVLLGFFNDPKHYIIINFIIIQTIVNIGITNFNSLIIRRF